MTFPADPHDRSPKGDHNRRLALGLEIEELAFHAGVSVDELRDYEFTPPDGKFDTIIAERVGEALEKLEAVVEPKIDQGGVPGKDPPAPAHSRL